MNTLFAASLFDSPWLFAIIIVLSALVNWLSKLRAQRQEEETMTEQEAPPVEPPPRPRQIPLDEVLRRLRGEDLLPERPIPPPLPQGPQGHSAPAVPPVQVPPLVREETMSAAARAVQEKLQATARQLKAVQRGGTPPRTTQPHQPERLRGRRRTGVNWGNPSTARQAFVASLVFGPPKGLE